MKSFINPKYYTNRYNNIPNLSNNLRLILKNEDESCKYLRKIYINYLKLLSREENLKSEVLDLSKYNCDISDNLLNFISNKQSDNLIIFSFTNNLSEKQIKLYEYCINNNINIFFVGNLNNHDILPTLHLNSLKLIKNIKDTKASNIFLNFDVDSFNVPDNWHMIQKRNYENILNKFASLTKEEIKKDPAKATFTSISIKNSYTKNISSYMKLDICKVMNIIKHVNHFCNKNNLSFGFDKKLANLSYNEINTENAIIISEISNLIYTLSIKDKKERVNYIYDSIYDYLEKDIKDYDYCNFINDKCIAQRDTLNNTNWPLCETNGCCYNIHQKHTCNNLNKADCTIHCISCRLFTCKYLKDKGIDYNIHKNLQVKCFLSPIKKPELVYNFYLEKEKILEKIN